MSEGSADSSVVPCQSSAVPCDTAALREGDVLCSVSYARFDGYEGELVRILVCQNSERWRAF